MADSKKRWHSVTGILLVLVLLCIGVGMVACRLQEETQSDKDTQNALSASELKIAHYETQLNQLTTQLSDMEQKYYGIQLDYTERIGQLTQQLETLLATETPTQQPDTDPTGDSKNLSGQEKTPDVDSASNTSDGDGSKGSENPPQGNNGEQRSEVPEGQEQYVRSYYTYYLKNGYAIITAYHGKDTDVTVPAAVDGHVVIGLADRAFAGSEVRNVTLPETIESIGWFTFYECKSLEKVILPSKLSSIGYASFDGCPQTLCLYVRDGSYAEQFAGSFGLRYEKIAY